MKHVSIFFAALLMTGIFSQSILASDNNSDQNLKNGMTHGLGAGGTVFWSWGFLYRHHFANKFGVATSLGGWFDGSSGYIGNEIGALYTLAHHDLSSKALKHSSIRVYAVAYLGNIYRKDYEYSLKGNIKIEKNYWDIGLGVGPGVEYFLNHNFALHAELPWMTFIRISNQATIFKSSYPHFGGGIVYYF